METKGILFLLQTHNPWNLSKEGPYEIFYDPLQKRVILLQSIFVYAFEIHDRSKDPNPVYFTLPVQFKEALALTINRDDRLMAIQYGPLHINFFDFGQPTLDQKQVTAQRKQYPLTFPSNKTKILGISFVQSPVIDFVICHCKGIELYKYNIMKKSLENLKSISYKTLDIWINPIDGIIILSSSSTKGEMQTYHLKKDETKGKNIKGPLFNLMLRQPDAANVAKSAKKKLDENAQKYYCAIPQASTRNIKLYNEEVKSLEKKREENFQIHKFLMGKLYSKNVFLHYNQTCGTIHLYRLDKAEAKRSLSVVTLDASICYEMQIADNLLLVSNLKTSLFTIYDIKSMHKFKTHLFQNGKVDLSYSNFYTCDNLEEIEGKTEKTTEKGYIIIESSIKVNELVEGETIDDSLTDAFVELKFNVQNDVFPLITSENTKIIDSSPKKGQEFNIKNYLILDSNLSYNDAKQQFFTYAFNKWKYLKVVSKKVPGLINLMRRASPKSIILTSIRKLMEGNISLQKLSRLFEKLSSVLKLSISKGIINPEKTEVHEVKRINGISALTQESYYKSGNSRPITYMSKIVEGARINMVSL